MELLYAKLLIVLATGMLTVEGQTEYRRVCYFANWAQHNDFPYSFFPEDIDPSLCTHIMFAFADVINGTVRSTQFNDESTSWSTGLYERVTDYKYISDVTVLLSIGGFSAGSEEFSAMAATVDTRAGFISDVIDFLRAYGFEGLDIDWEYPAHRGSPPEDRQRFVVLADELREAFEQESSDTGLPRLLLTCAVGAPPIIARDAYDIETMYRIFDFVTLMTYDFHGGWEERTGHNSPLYPRVNEIGSQRSLNLHSSATYWVENGAIPEKTNIGIALYGRTFNLTDPGEFGMGAPVYGSWDPAIIEYYKVCELLADNAERYWDSEQEVPYLVKDNLWVGYDDPQSISLKVEYVKNYGYGGTSVWVLHSDDWLGTCGDEQGLNPLMNTILIGLGQPRDQ
ncbi:acidic mammalian chitinase-like [Liolophura sinensis]|uniref:acidic mammalian chitinase-like n=1 Tax=Liolophura sinensis TaxID=3198878 RepID=UPI003158F15F